MLYINAKAGDRLNLGFEGENLARTIRFDIVKWQTLYSEGVVSLLHQRAGDTDPYPCVVTVTGSIVEWAITASDTDVAGYGKYELQYIVGETLAKSCSGTTYVSDALGEPSEEPPEPQRRWADKVLQAGADAVDAAKRAEDALTKGPVIDVENGNWFVWDAALGEYVDTGRFSGGAAPYVGSNGNWFIGNEDTGVSATGLQGPKGDTGPQGPAGPQGPKGATGAQGPKGDKGDKGDTGATGATGATGPKGDKGDKGDTGEQGPKGDTGEQGEQGPEGPRGPQGEAGPEGPEGPQGATGPQGEQGPRGENGPAGPQGNIGPQGERGESGLPVIVNLSGAAQSLALANNTDYRCADAVTSLTVTGFAGGTAGRSELWSIQFIAGDGITVALPDTVVWNYGATPVFTAGSEYSLVFTPMLGGKVLGVWNEVEA